MLAAPDAVTHSLAQPLSDVLQGWGHRQNLPLTPPELAPHGGGATGCDVLTAGSVEQPS